MNSLDPDQAQYNVAPDLVPECLTLIFSFFLKTFILEKISEDDKTACKITLISL